MDNKLIARNGNNAALKSQGGKSLDERCALMNAAMERLGLANRKHGGALPSKAPAPEIVELACVCAVHDKPYTLRFTRQASGLLRFSESVRVEPARHRTALAGAAAAALAFSLAEFEQNSGSLATPCAWCGEGSFHHCASYCGALVCGGRMRARGFTVGQAAGPHGSVCRWRRLKEPGNSKPGNPWLRLRVNLKPRRSRLPRGN